MTQSKGTTFPTDGNGEAIQALRPSITHTLNFTGISTATPVFQKTTVVVRVYATQDCFVDFGVTPVADNTQMPLPGGLVEFFKVEDNDKIAAIQDTSAGTLYITELG